MSSDSLPEYQLTKDIISISYLQLLNVFIRTEKSKYTIQEKKEGYKSLFNKNSKYESCYELVQNKLGTIQHVISTLIQLLRIDYINY